MDKPNSITATLTHGEYPSSYKAGEEVTFQFYQKTPKRMIAQNDYALPYGLLSEEVTAQVRQALTDGWRAVGLVKSVSHEGCEIIIQFYKSRG